MGEGKIFDEEGGSCRSINYMNASVENITVRYFNRCQVEVVRSFYSLTPYKNGQSAREDDEIVAAFEGNRIIGVFRLCEEEGICVLRGFFVLAEYQRKGIGSLMLMKFEDELEGRSCYLICRNYLNGFYAQAGFEKCLENRPAFLIERVKKYNNALLNILTRKL